MCRTSALKCLSVVVALLMPFSATAYAAGLETLATYRAVYDLQLDSASEKAGMTGLTGRLVYEFNGNRCEGYTTQARSAIRFDVEGVAERLVDQQATTYETADGREFHFASKNYVDEKLSEEITGVATLKDKGIEVRLSKPSASQSNLAMASFPLQYTLAAINNARAGKHFARIAVFDGSDGADERVETTLIIGKAKKPAPDNETKVMGPLGANPVWPVTISYFNDDENKDGMPTYRTSFLLYENGITRDLLMDYGDFSVRGKLVKLDILQNAVGKDSPCPQ